MPIITVCGDAGIFWIACAVVLLFFPKTRKIGLGMGIAMAMGLLVCNVTLKPLVARSRPYDFQIKELGKTWNDILLAGKLLVETPHDFSFPSGHTIASFEAATVLLINNKKFKVGIPALILAILIAFSRLYLYVHYPTDVIFSVFAGILFGFIGHLLAQKIKLPSGKKGKYQR
jgi:undecaprenyl-diphosphatase